MSDQVFAVHRYARISPFKARLVANQLRNQSVIDALEILNFSNKKSAGLFKKVLNSAISNAEHNQGLDIDDLVISYVVVDVASRMKRLRPRARGRPNRIYKRMSHLTLGLRAKQ